MSPAAKENEVLTSIPENATARPQPVALEVPVTVKLEISSGYNGSDPGVLNFQVATMTVGPKKIDQFITQEITRRVPVPAPGAIVLAANT